MKYIASCSFGKDSIATILLAREHNEPLDEIVYCEVMFDKEISGELPEHRDFIYNKAIPVFESLGYKVTVLHPPKTFIDYFHRKAVKGKSIGRKKGFPMANHCGVQTECKLKPIHDFYKTMSDNFIQYIGIAIDEPKRLNRIAKSTNQMSLMQKYRYTEQMAFNLCKKYDLLSPVYSFVPRNGCWFCPNARDCALRYLRNNHRDLWDKLLELENIPNLIGNKWNTLTQTSIHDKEEQFMWEDRQMNIFDYIKESEVV